MKLERLRAALRGGDLVRDEDFDEVFPIPYRQVSNYFWTPVETARRASALLVAEGARRILDVGAGVGKFCLVGAASTRKATFVGVEHRAHLVDAARDAARSLQVARVEMIQARFSAEIASGFDAFYLYNPFAENFFDASSRLDDTVTLSPERYHDEIDITHQVLSAAPRGTNVVTFWGFGARMPPRYHLVHTECSRGGSLSLWIKSDA